MQTTGTWRREGPYIVFDTSTPSRPRRRGMRRELEFEYEFESGGGQPTIRRGSSGSAVRDAQARLLAHGFNPGPIDGIFGSGTDSATRSFQRARGLTVDGVIGPNTWGALTSTPRQAPAPSRPPSSRPQPAPAPGGTGRGAKIVAEALKHLGFQEGPNNDNPFSSHFGVHNVAWCCYFVSYCYTKAGVPLNHGSCSALLDYLVDRDKFFGTTPSPGDIVIFDWTLGDHDEAEHAGIVERTSKDSNGGTRVHTIEGNSGNGVNRREYAITSDSIVGFGRLP